MEFPETPGKLPAGVKSEGAGKKPNNEYYYAANSYRSVET